MAKDKSKQNLPSAPSFEGDLKLWLEGKVMSMLVMNGLFTREDFRNWANLTAQRADKTMRKLYERHEIRPSAVMNMLASLWMHFARDRQLFGNPPPQWISNSRKRQHAIKQFAEVIEYCKELGKSDRNDVIEELERYKGNLEALPTRLPHRPVASWLIWCVQNLVAFMNESASKPVQLHLHVGRLLRAGFPDSWVTADDGEAVRKLIERNPPNNLLRPTILESLMIQQGKSIFNVKQYFDAKGNLAGQNWKEMRNRLMQTSGERSHRKSRHKERGHISVLIPPRGRW